jgi:hypothetical protein
MAAPKLQKLREWAEETLLTEVPVRTLQHWCVNGHIPARKLGRCWFVEVDKVTASTGDDLVDQILQAV